VTVEKCEGREDLYTMKHLLECCFCPGVKEIETFNEVQDRVLSIGIELSI